MTNIQYTVITSTIREYVYVSEFNSNSGTFKILIVKKYVKSWSTLILIDPGGTLVILWPMWPMLYKLPTLPLTLLYTVLWMPPFDKLWKTWYVHHEIVFLHSQSRAWALQVRWRKGKQWSWGGIRRTLPFSQLCKDFFQREFLDNF